MARTMTVRLVSGSGPPDLCGVGDYTARLADALGTLGVDVDVVRQHRADRLGGVIAAQPRHAIVHLQYPTVGIGASPGPLVGLLRRRNVVLTEHEYSYAHPLRRAMAVALGNACGQVIVTNQLERRRMSRWLWRVPVSVLPIPSNIPVSMAARPRVPGQPLAAERPFTLGWFGIVRPDQGLGQFLELAERLLAGGQAVRIVVIGGWHARDAEAVAALRTRTRRWPIRWTGRLDELAVSAELASLDAAYLPYPDGISERRASALALFGHGVPVLSTLGEATTDELAGCVLAAAGPEHAAQRLGQLDRAGQQQLIGRAAAYAARRSPARLAEQHLAIYQAVLCRQAGPLQPRGVTRSTDRMTRLTKRVRSGAGGARSGGGAGGA
jgi:glycosyltransferase involved in cell wall biosynthesis